MTDIVFSASHNPLARATAELLADGAWHDYHDVVDQVAVKVPPGRALRTNERLRAKNKKESPPERLRDRRGEEFLIRSGARAIVRDTIRNGKLFEMDPVGKVPRGSKRIRLTEEGLRRWRKTLETESADVTPPDVDHVSSASDLVDQVLREHVIRAYDCSCGADVNSHDRHLVRAAIEAARKDARGY